MENNFDVSISDESEHVVHLNITGDYMFKTDSKIVADSIIKALEKQIPKKIDVYDFGKAHCPRCKTDIHGIGKLSYCCYCGQNLEWY